MRALCGAIITAGALICLGMTALGFGTRYSHVAGAIRTADDGTVTELTPPRIPLGDMDRPLVFCLVLATLATLIGLGITFVGLAYHHYRRHHELLKNHPELTGYHHGTGTTSTHSMPPPPP